MNVCFRSISHCRRVCMCLFSFSFSSFSFQFSIRVLVCVSGESCLVSPVMLCFDLRFYKRNFRLDQKLIVWYLFRLKKRIKKLPQKISKGSPFAHVFRKKLSKGPPFAYVFRKNFKKNYQGGGGVLAFSPPGFVKCATRCNEICFL